MKRFLFFCLATLFAVTSWAQDYNYDFYAVNSDGVTIYYTILDESAMTVEVANENRSIASTYTGEVNIPETASYEDETFDVVGIGNTAFWESSITRVTIPNTVTSIGDYAFENCTGLTEIEIPNSVTSIGISAFTYCSNLAKVTLSEKLESISNNMFSYCTSLASIDIPSSVTSIGSEAFYLCSALTEIKIPDSVTSIGGIAFEYCSSLEEITIPSGVTIISSGMLSDCSSLVKVVLSEGVTEIQDNAFDADYYLEDINLPSTLTTIGNWVFNECDEGLSEITIPANVTSIGQGAFADCASLKTINYNAIACDDAGDSLFPAFTGCTNVNEVNVGEGVTIIPAYLCKGFKNLTSITLPESIESIGAGVFAVDGRTACGVTEITSLPTTPPSCADDSFSGLDTETCVIYVPKNCVEAYAAAGVWMDFTNIEEISSEDEGTPLEKWAKFEVDGVYYQVTDSDNREVEVTSEEEPWEDFGSYTGDIIIPATVTYENVEYTVVGVGEAAFWYSEKLTSVSLPSSLTYFGEYAFNACFLLKEITIPAALTTLSEAAISECYALETIKVEEGNTSFCVEDGVLYTMDKTSLIQYPVASSATSFVIPEEVEYVEVSAFAGSQNLTEVTIASTVTYIKLDAFWYCENLLTVYSLATTPPEMDNVIFYTSGPNWANSVLYVPAECVDLYKNAKVWNSFGTIKEIGDEPLEDGDTFDYNGIIYKVVSAEDKTVEVTYYGDSYSADDAVAYYTGNITIPASFEYRDATYTVIGVGDYAFYKSGVLSISFDTPSNVTYLGTRAMYNCTAITELELPEGVLTVGDQSLRQCTSMTTLKLPETVTYLGEYLCWGNTALKAINIPSSVTTLGKYVFYNCSAATELTLSPNITDWGGHAFYDCEALTHVDIPEGITEVGEYAFSNCDGLVSVSIPDEVTTLGGHTFAACSKLESCVLPESMTEVDGYLFYNCPALTEVTIGSNVESFGSNVFAGCPALAAVYSLNPVPPTINSNTFSSTSLNGATDKETCVLYVPCGSEEDYASADYWSAFANIVGYDCPEVQTFDYTLDPAEGEVSSLHNISISYDDGVKLNVSESKWGNAKVYDANGDEVVEVIIATPIGTYGQTYTGYNFTLGLDGSSQDVTEAGDYYFVIPEGYISFYDSANDTWVECEQIIAHYVIEGDGDKGGTEAPYTVEPAEGIVESLSYVKFIDEGAICYTEEVDPSEVKVYKDGDISSAVAYGVSVEDDYTSGSWDDAVKVTFNTTLTVAGEYTVVVPEGLFNIGSWTVVNDEITLNYIVDGSADTGTFVCDVDPADGAKVTKLDQIIFTNPSGGEIFVNEEIWNPEINVYDEGGVLITQVTNFYTDFGDNWEELAQIAMFGGSDDEGNVYPSEITAEGTYYVSVPANVFFIYDEGGNVCYNESMSLTYIVSADAGTENPDYTLSFSPEDGSTLDVLSTITISCEDGITQVLMPDEEITITDDSGNTWSGNYTITEVANDLGIVTQVVISLNPEIAEAGTYYVNVPWGYFDINQHMNEAFTLTYTITGTYTGISGISINDENVEGIYSVGGQKLNATQKGVNIIRFSDGGVKKLYVK